MAINPFRGMTNYDIPQAPPPAGRWDPSVFTNIASIGEAIGRDRLQQQIGQLTVTDDQGRIDYNATEANLARAGLLRPEAIQTGGYRQQVLAQHASDAAALEAHRRAQEDTARIVANRPTYHFQAPVEPDILTPGRPGVIIEAPRVPGQPPIYHPWTGPPAAAPPSTPGPQSALPGPNFAALDPNNPENAPPYRVAGPPMPPPQGPVTAAPAEPSTQPAAAPARNDAFLRGLPTDAGRTLVKGVADYEIDPNSLPAEIRAKVLAAAKTYRPDFSAAEYQKRGAPVSGEVAGRTGLAKSFLDIYPEVKRRIEADEINTLGGRAAAAFGQGYPAELNNAIKEGAESLLRGLTGAGMNKDEAADYASRYQVRSFDTKETQLLKIRGLDRALRYVVTETGKGRGGDDFLKGYRSQFGAPLEGTAPVHVSSPEEARKYPKGTKIILPDGTPGRVP